MRSTWSEHVSTGAECIDMAFDPSRPFNDLLNLLYLVDKGLLDIPVLYLSRHIIRNKALYYQHLLQVTTRQAWETWILFILEAVRTTAEWTTAKIHAIRDLLDETAGAIRLPDQRRGQCGHRQASDGRRLSESPRSRRPPPRNQGGTREPLHQPADAGASGRARVTQHGNIMTAGVVRPLVMQAAQMGAGPPPNNRP